MKQKGTESSPVRIRRELLNTQVAAIKDAGGFESDVQAINRLIECCGPVFVAVLEHQQAVLASLASGLPLPTLKLPPAVLPRPSPSAAIGGIDPSQLDDF